MSTAAGALPAVAVAVDVAVLTVHGRELRVRLARLRAGPFADAWALPGGRVRSEESLDAAARRILGAPGRGSALHLEQLYTFGSPQRDPAGRVVSVAYLALGRPTRPPFADDPRYAELAWHPVARLPALAYDHRAVVRAAVDRLRAKLAYTNIVYALLPGDFTLGELQETYEAILGRALDRRNFRKKLLSLGLLRRLDRVRRGPHRPAVLYAFRRRRPIVIDVL